MTTNPKHILSTVLAVAVLAGFWISSSSTASAGQVGTNAATDTNLSASLADDAASYFIFPSEQEIFSNIDKGNGQEGPQAAAELPQGNNSVDMAAISDYQIPGPKGNTIHLRLYGPSEDKNSASPLLIHVYGGGGMMDFFDTSMRRLANSTGFKVATMNYGQGPFPAALNDVIATVRWIAENGKDRLGIDPSRIALGGHSFGANMALSTALALKDSHNAQERDLVKVLYLLNGFYSPNVLSSESMKMFGHGQYGLSYEDAKMAFDHIFQNRSDYSNPLAFPLLSQNMTGLPPVYIVAAGVDPAKDESIDLANRLRDAGQEYYLTIWPGVGHSSGSLIFIDQTPEIQEYLGAMTTYLKAELSNS